MLYLYRLIATDATDPLLRRGILINSLVNYRGRPNSFSEIYRAVKIHNGNMKRILRERHTSSNILENLFEYSAINAPAFHNLHDELH